MFLIRPGEPGDRSAVEAMVADRARWLRDNGHGRWRGWAKNAEVLAGMVGDPEQPAAWLLTDPAGCVLGMTTLGSTPEVGWTERERGEFATFLQSTLTHPAHAGRGLGALIAFWALDHAARGGRLWVRRGVLTDEDGANLGLVRYYRRQGWRVVRTVRHPAKPVVTVWSLARPASAQPDITDLVRENPSALRGIDPPQGTAGPRVGRPRGH